MKKLFFLSIIVLMILLAGCTSEKGTEHYFAAEANTINTFAMVEEGDVFRAYFILQDKEGLNTTADGKVELTIKDNSGELLLSKSFDIKQSDFVDYQIMLTGAGMGKAYEWRIQKNEIKKGTSQFGNAELKFTLKNGTVLKNEASIFNLEAYTQEEIEQAEEENFSKTAIPINETQKIGNWEVTVISAGFFQQKSGWQSGEKFRVNLKVTNKGAEKEYFSPSGMAILDNKGNQYEKEYGGTLDTFSEIYPNVSKEGSVLFKVFPKDTNSVKLVFELGYNEQYKPYLWEFNLPLTK